MFDLGDTLILTDRWDYDKCLTRLLESLQRDKIGTGIPYDEFKRVYFEVRNQLYLESESSLNEVDFQQRIAETLEKFSYETSSSDPTVTRATDVFVQAFIEDLRMEDFVPGLLAELKKEHKLALVSNFAYGPGPLKVLQRFDLAEFFDTVIVSAEVGVRKPHKRIFKEALKRLNVKAEEAVFVGDSLKADIYGAKKLGLKAILVENIGIRRNPYAIAGELDPFPVEPDAKIPTLKDLVQVLKEL